MTRLIHTIALAAAAVVLGTGLWRGWGLWATSRRLLLAYLGFFFLGALLALAVRLVPLLDKQAPAPEEKGRRRRHRKAETPPAEA